VKSSARGSADAGTPAKKSDAREQGIIFNNTASHFELSRRDAKFVFTLCRADRL